MIRLRTGLLIEENFILRSDLKKTPHNKTTPLLTYLHQCMVQWVRIFSFYFGGKKDMELKMVKSMTANKVHRWHHSLPNTWQTSIISTNNVKIHQIILALNTLHFHNICKFIQLSFFSPAVHIFLLLSVVTYLSRFTSGVLHSFFYLLRNVLDCSFTQTINRGYFVISNLALNLQITTTEQYW